MLTYLRTNCLEESEGRRCGTRSEWILEMEVVAAPVRSYQTRVRDCQV